MYCNQLHKTATVCFIVNKQQTYHCQSSEELSQAYLTSDNIKVHMNRS